MSIRKLCIALITLGVAACASTRPEPGQPLLVTRLDSQTRLAAALAMPVCQDSLPVVGDTTGLGLIAPQTSTLVGPPNPFPRELRGVTSEVRVLVNVRGGIDSIVVTGIVDTLYVNKLREGMIAHAKYLPAQMNGCRRAGWTMHKVTFH